MLEKNWKEVFCELSIEAVETQSQCFRVVTTVTIDTIDTYSVYGAQEEPIILANLWLVNGKMINVGEKVESRTNCLQQLSIALYCNLLNHGIWKTVFTQYHCHMWKSQLWNCAHNTIYVEESTVLDALRHRVSESHSKCALCRKSTATFTLVNINLTQS